MQMIKGMGLFAGHTQRLCARISLKHRCGTGEAGWGNSSETPTTKGLFPSQGKPEAAFLPDPATQVKANYRISLLHAALTQPLQ